MANIKITELDAATTLASTDVLVAVDVSEDVTKKTTVTDLFRTLPDGTAAAPALAFADDNNTGILSPAENQLAFTTGGTQRVTIDGSGNVTISGGLTVEGQTTTVESTVVTIDDKNIELGSVASPSNTTADGGGITLKGATDKTIKWINSTGYWTFNTGIEVGGHLQIDDSNEIRLGTGQDLKIYHSGTNSHLVNTTGGLFIDQYLDDGDISLRSDNGSGGLSTYVLCDGSTGNVRLYYYGTEKFKTKSDGIDVTGEVQCDSLDVDGAVDITGNVTLHANLDLQDDDRLNIGSGNDFTIRHDGSNSIFENDTGHLYISNYADNKQIILRSDDSSGGIANYLVCDGNGGSVNLYHYGSQKLNTKSDGIDVTGEVQCDSLDVDGTADITGNVVLHNHLDLGDDNHIRIGTGDDLKIYHDGSNSIIRNTTGHLKVRANTFHINNSDDNESMALFTANGSVRLFYDNSKKLETKSDGIDVVGEVQCDSLDVDGVADITGNVTLHANLDLQDNDRIRCGSSDDLQIYHDATNSVITNATGDLHIRGDGDDIYLRAADDVFIQTQNGETAAKFIGDGAVQLNYDDIQKFATKSDGVDITGELQCDSLDVDGAADITGTLTLHSHLDLQDSDHIKFGTDDDLEIYFDGTDGVIRQLTGNHLYIQNLTDDKDVIIRSDNGSGSLAFYVQCDGSNGEVRLYHYGIEKFNTKSDGVLVHGELECNTLDVNGVANIGASNTSDAQLEIGAGATGNRNAYVDLIGDTTYTDYGLRVQRDNGGANGASKILHRGTGDFRLVAQEAAAMEFFTSNLERARIDSSGRFLLGTTTEGAAGADNLTVADSGTCGVTIRSGTSSNGNIYFSDATSGSGEYAGYIQFRHGDNALAFGDSSAERFRITSTGAWAIEGASNYGTSGQILTSNGNDAPSWQDAGSVAVGGASAISMNDSVKINFGNSSDLQIYHNGTNSLIENSTGELLLRAKAGENSINCNPDGSVELFHNNSKKFETNSGGIDVTGESKCDTLNVDGTADIAGQLSVDRVVIRDNGSSSPLLAIRADDAGPWGIIIGNDSYSTNTNYGLAIYQGSSGDVAQQLKGNGAWENFYLQQSDGSTTNTAIHITSSRAVALKYQNNTKLQTKSDGVDITGELQCDSLDVDGAASFTRSGSGTQDVADFYNGTSNGNTRIKVRTYANGGGDPFIFFDGGGTNFVVGEQWNGTTNNILRLGAGDNMGTVKGMFITADGHCKPDANNARDLGDSSNRWRNVYTNDLNLSNEGSTNDVDGTWGNYTIQEGEDDLFLINRRNGKKYKFNLTEVS